MRITITGPVGSTLNVYVDNTFVDTTPRGDINSAEYINPIILQRGQQLRLVWSVGTGTPTPQATLYVEEAFGSVFA